MNQKKDVFTEEGAMEFEETSGNNGGGESENDRQDQVGEEKARKGPYALHGLFSRSPWKILAKAGEDMKKLAVTERMFYEHFKPRNAFEEFIVDRSWSCVLRCVLIGREEERIFGTAAKPGEERIKDAGALAAYGGSKVIAEQTSSGLMNELGNMVRYDLYYGKELTRWLGFLETLRNGGDGGYVFGLPKKGGGKGEDN